MIDTSYKFKGRPLEVATQYAELISQLRKYGAKFIITSIPVKSVEAKESKTNICRVTSTYVSITLLNPVNGLPTSNIFVECEVEDAHKSKGDVDDKKSNPLSSKQGN